MMERTIPLLITVAGVSKDVVALAMVFSGIVEIPCRICNGFLADRKYMSATAQYTLCLFMCGALTLGATYLPGTAGRCDVLGTLLNHVTFLILIQRETP